jgi:hypothetical protein
MVDADRRSGTWPELLYRFIEHYKWEPHHLKALDYDARMRRQEVPLNFMLNLLLRCSTSHTIRTLLGSFHPQCAALDDDLAVMFPWETNKTQPDIRLEGSQSRIFIEVKVRAPVELSQVRKYAQLHQDMDAKFGHKDHYLLFLTQRPFDQCWKPRSAVVDFKDAHSFVERQLAEQTGLDQTTSVKCSAVTWASFGRRLQEVSSSLDSDRIVERRIIGDFLDDLQARALLG